MYYTLTGKNSTRGKDFLDFSLNVWDHIENYTVPQYGDFPDDYIAERPIEECVFAIQRYLARIGRQSRKGEGKLDMVKVAHYAQLIHDKLEDN